jgi:hypothetical protein
LAKAKLRSDWNADSKAELESAVIPGDADGRTSTSGTANDAWT